jgi:hypothetical protein
MNTTVQIEAGRPVALQTVADVDKAAAITAAYKAVAGIALKASIEMIDYNGRLGGRGPFRQYAELRFNLLADDASKAADALVEAMQRVDDATLADAIAKQLGQLTGEGYQGYIATKYIGTGNKQDGRVANIRLQLAKV